MLNLSIYYDCCECSYYWAIMRGYEINNFMGTYYYNKGEISVNLPVVIRVYGSPP